MLIEQLIGDLLLRHNCVVVPSFGGFVARQSPAALDIANGTMLPPRKSLLFNKQLINNDGLLIASLAQETGSSYDQAAEEIRRQVAQWQHTLNEGERVTFDRVGYLFLDQEKNIGFEQDRYFNLLLQSYGLGKVHFISEEDIQIVAQPAERMHPAAAEKPEMKIAPVESPLPQPARTPVIELIPEGIEIAPVAEEERKIISLPQRTGSVRLWRYAAAAALIPIAFYSYWIPMKTRVLESGVFAFQDFNPFHSENTALYKSKELTYQLDTAVVKPMSVKEQTATLSEDVAVWSYPFDENLYMPVRIHEPKTAQAAPAEKTAIPVAETIQPVKAATSVATGNYHLIANCFGSEANAQKFVEYLRSKGFDAYIVDINKGLHRVSAGKAANAATLQSTQEKLDQLRIEGSWILKS